MDLSLNATQQLIRESARDFVRGACSRDVLVKLDRDPSGIAGVWDTIARLGWAGMAVPEDYGGTGNTLTDVAVLFEELGAGPVPGALFSSAVLCARLLLEAASAEQKKAWLPGIASGERIFALALTEARYGWSPDAISLAPVRAGDGFMLTGTKVFVHDAASATDFLVLCRAREGAGTSLLRVDARAPGVNVRPLAGFLTGLAEVRFERVEASAEDLVGADGQAWEPVRRAMIAALPVLCSYMVGGCRAVFEMSVEYSRERIQFQQPIGRFQRVQDHVIRIVNFLDAARWTTAEALWKLDTGRDAAGSVHIAKAVASESYVGACDFAHEVHAGIGVVREYGLTLHTRMSRSLYHCLGAPALHRRELETVLGLVEG